MFEHLTKENLQLKFYDDVISASAKETERLRAELEHRLLGLPTGEKKLEIEKALKDTVVRLQEQNKEDSFRETMGILTAKADINRFSGRKLRDNNISEWISEVSELEGFLNGLRQNVTSWSSLFSGQTTDKPSTGNAPRPYSDCFDSRDFYYHLADGYFDSLEATEKICSEIDELLPEIHRTLAQDDSEVTRAKLRRLATDMRMIATEIDSVKQRVSNRVLDRYYDHVFTSKVKDVVVIHRSLYDYKRYLQKKLSGFTDIETGETDADTWSYEPGDNLTLKNHNDEDVRRQVSNIRDGLKELGLIPTDTNGSVVSSVFSDRMIKTPITWTGTQYELHFLIKRLRKHMVSNSKGAYSRAEKLFIKQDGSKFQNLMNAGGGSTLRPQLAEKYTRLLDRAAKNLR